MHKTVLEDCSNNRISMKNKLFNDIPLPANIFKPSWPLMVLLKTFMNSLKGLRHSLGMSNCWHAFGVAYICARKCYSPVIKQPSSTKAM